MKSEHRILIVEDVKPQRVLLCGMLKKEGYKVSEAEDGKQARKLLAEEQFDVALIDWELPDVAGIDLIEEFENSDEDFLPMIILTSHNEPELISESFDKGAFDFLTKPAHPVELRARIRCALKFRSLQMRYQELAYRDPLTGMYNRRYFEKNTPKILELCVENEQPLAITMVDIDHFKNVNDTYGHDIGDLVLNQMAKLLNGSIRSCDYVCRLGGEEFAVVFQKSDAVNAKRVMQRILESAMDRQWGERGDTFKLSFSAGIADTSSVDEINHTDILALADSALYEAKEGGRKQVRTIEESKLEPKKTNQNSAS